MGKDKASTKGTKGGDVRTSTNMCVVICFNSQWRSVVIGTVSCIFSLFLLFLTIGYQDMIENKIASRIVENNCYHFRCSTLQSIALASINNSFIFMIRQGGIVLM